MGELFVSSGRLEPLGTVLLVVAIATLTSLAYYRFALRPKLLLVRRAADSVAAWANREGYALREVHRFKLYHRLVDGRPVVVRLYGMGNGLGNGLKIGSGSFKVVALISTFAAQPRATTEVVDGVTYAPNRLALVYGKGPANAILGGVTYGTELQIKSDIDPAALNAAITRLLSIAS